jgi:hypothetical protein
MSDQPSFTANYLGFRVNRCDNALNSLAANRIKSAELDAAWELRALDRAVQNGGGALPAMPPHVASALRRFRHG